MTESAGANAPQDQASQETTERTITIQDLCVQWGVSAEEAENLQKFMGQDGPWTPEEAEELDRRMGSFDPADRFPGFTGQPQVWAIPQEPDGPHGPGCECGKLTAEELNGVETLMEALAPALAEALGMGRTPAEARTGVSDPEAAIMGELNAIRTAAQEYGKFTGHLGVATAHMTTNPTRAIPALQEAATRASHQANRVEEGISRIGSWLPQVRGRRAVDGNGVPLYLNKEDPSVMASFTEPPADGWRPLYIH